MRWRGLAAAPVAATVIVEIVLTLAVLYLFTAVGLLLLVELGAAAREYHRLLLAFVLTLPVPVVTALLLQVRLGVRAPAEISAPVGGRQRHVRSSGGARSRAPRLHASGPAIAARGRTAVRGVRLRVVRNLVRAAPVWPPGRLRRRPGAREHDSGGAASGVRGARRNRRAGSRLGAYSGRRSASAANWRWPSPWPSACAKCCAVCRRWRPGSGWRAGGCRIEPVIAQLASATPDR